MAPELSPPDPAARPSVLVVDDEDELLNVMREALEPAFDVTTATTAAEAEAKMAARNFAVVVSDHLMPGEGGLDFLVRMREIHPATRRILLTGYMNPELISRSVSVAELATCLLKPVNLDELVRAVGAAAG